MKKILQRFVDIWKLDFLAIFFAEKKNDNKMTIKFFIFSSMLLTMLVSAAFFIIVFINSDELIAEINKNIPDDVIVVMSEGNLTIKNLQQPFLKEMTIKSDGNSDQIVVFVVDTQNNSYDNGALEDYDGGVVILSNRMIVKNVFQIHENSFADMTDFSISKNEIISFIEDGKKFGGLITEFTLAIGIITIIWFVIIRGVFALWWALMLYVMLRIYAIDQTYGVAYKAVLNLYFIPSLVAIILLIFGVNIPLLTTIIFVTLFIMNLMWIKKQPDIADVKNVKLTVKQLDEEKTSVKTTKK